jgi:8-oxo-dGTP pyrophosphatase MutT (NUDIX family)
MRLAATVILARTAGARFELFMLRRSESSHFVPDAYVFPGGTLSEIDLSERALARTRFAQDEAALRARISAVTADVPLASDRELSALFFAALRELYEEAGVFFACDAAGNTVENAGDDSRIDFLQSLERSNLYADARQLALFSQWLTPPQFPKRYNTHFFLAAAPKNAVAAADAHETHDGIWIAPADALARNEAGDLHLVYPTIKHLERLAQFATLDDLFAFARTKPVLALSPETVNDGFALPPALENAW